MELKSPLPQGSIESSQQNPPLGDCGSMILRGSQEALYFSAPNGTVLEVSKASYPCMHIRESTQGYPGKLQPPAQPPPRPSPAWQSTGYHLVWDTCAHGLAPASLLQTLIFPARFEPHLLPIRSYHRLESLSDLVWL